MLNKSQIKIRVLSFFIITSILTADPIIGNRAPEFSLPDQDGVIRNLGDFRGRKLVVYFFPKADTPG
jgi:peroxiredoxin